LRKKMRDTKELGYESYKDVQWLDEFNSSRSGKRKSRKRGDKEERGERKKRTDGRQIILGR
jgi:hypothetical protein